MSLIGHAVVAKSDAGTVIAILIGMKSLIAYLLTLASLITLAPTWAADDALAMGVLPRRNVTETINMFRPIADELEKALGRRVEVKTARDFSAFAHEVNAMRYDLVHLNQLQYIQAQRLGYQAIAKNEEHGKTTVRSAIIVRKDSGITSLAELKGKRIAFGGDRNAVVSYVIPTALLRAGGLMANDYTEVFTRNPMNAVVVTYIGETDASGANSSATQPGFVSGVDADKIRLLVQSEPLPHLPWAASPRLSPALKTHIQAVLTDLHNNDDGRRALASAQLTGLAPASDSDYDAHRRLLSDRLPKK